MRDFIRNKSLKNKWWLLGIASWIFVATSTAMGETASEASTRQTIPINDEWRFHKQDTSDSAVRDSLDAWILPTGNAFLADPEMRHQRPATEPKGDFPFARPGFDDSEWALVTLPHDWAIAGPFIETGDHGGMGRLPSWGTGWYRKSLEIPESESGRSIFLDVDGAMSYASVWVNGRLAGGWPYGYNSWRLDITDYVEPGKPNSLAIRLDNPPESSRWYPGGGLYRNVWLTSTAKQHVSHWGTFVTTPAVSRDRAVAELTVSVDNDDQTDVQVSVGTELFFLAADDKPVGTAVAATGTREIQVPAGMTTSVTDQVTIENPNLWGPPPGQVPNRYVAVTTILRDDQVIDRYETTFGIRDVRFDPDQGVLINDVHVPLQGVNMHHDLGALGAAFNTRAAERQLEILKKMGTNAIRMAHNPPAPELLDFTDRMGFLVIDEIFDVWQRKKTPQDSHLFFDAWHEQDLRAFLRRDRNHPSVILWSVGNEVGEQHTMEEGAEVARGLVRITHEEDPTRPVTASMNWADADMPFPETVDVITLNYQGVGIRTLPSDFPAFRREFPDKVILSSESAAALSTRGTYLFPVSGNRSGPVRPGIGGDEETGFVSAYELHAADFGSSADKSFALHDQHPYVAGEFVWSGFDYLGEPTPFYDWRSSYFGIIDLAGFPKDRFYLYQSRWRPDLPMVHILPHWNWPGREGEVTPVHVFTSGDEVELFLNGESLGRKTKAPFQYRLRWDYVEYEPGTLEAVAYRDGAEWSTTTVQTTGPAARLELTVDREQIAADGKDLSFVTLRVSDSEGRTVPEASNPIIFEVEGPAEIIATDNGDPRSFVPFPSHEREAFSGLALAIIRGVPGKPGTIRVRATSPSLEAGEVLIETALD